MKDSYKAFSRDSFLTIVGLTLLALSVRLFWLHHPAPWKDEIFSILYAREEISHLLSLTRDTDIHPSLYYLMLKGVASLFGEERTTLRLLSVAFGTFSVPVFFLLVKEHLGLRVAILSTVFFCILPVNVHFSREIRAYSALAFFLLVAIYFFTRISYISTQSAVIKSRDSLVFAISLAATFHLHYSALVYFFLFLLAAMALFWFDRDAVKLRTLLFATFGAGILCLPQSVHFLYYSSPVVGSDFWIPPTSLEHFYRVSLGAYPFPGWTKLLAILVYLTGLILLLRKDFRFALILLVFTALGPLLVATIGVFKPAYLVRSIQAFTVLSPVLLGVALAAMPRGAMAVATVGLLAIHIAAVQHDYPTKRQPLTVELLLPILQDSQTKTVYYHDALEPQFELFGLPWSEWTSIGLQEFEAAKEINDSLGSCYSNPSCGETILIMEQEPRFLVSEGQFWMEFLDNIATNHPVNRDEIGAGYRVLILE